MTLNSSFALAFKVQCHQFDGHSDLAGGFGVVQLPSTSMFVSDHVKEFDRFLIYIVLYFAYCRLAGRPPRRTIRP